MPERSRYMSAEEYELRSLHIRAKKMVKLGVALMGVSSAAALTAAVLELPVPAVVALGTLAVNAKLLSTNIHNERSLRDQRYARWGHLGWLAYLRGARLD